MFQLILIMFVIVQTGAINYSDSVDYCKLDCEDWDGVHKHTVCLRASAKCGPHERCQEFQVLSQTDDFRQMILDKHNYLRNKVALGQEKQGPQPKAANMNILNWNDELAFIAQCWANSCEDDHDKCRRTDHLVVGQNVGLKGRSQPLAFDDIRLVDERIQAWYNEVADFNPASIQYYDGISGAGHYTEMIWGEIQYVGCGGALYKEGIWFTLLLICNYGGPTTGGNLRGAKVYKIGEPCSQCPSGTRCNKKYKGLCGVNYPVQSRHTEHSSTPGYNSGSRAKSSYNFVSSTAQSFSTSNGVSDSTIVNNNRPMQKQTIKIEVDRPKIMFIRTILRHS